MSRKRLMRVVDTVMTCPACGSPLAIRTSRQASELLREQYCDCTNDCCPHRFKVVQEIVASLHEGSYEHGMQLPASLRRQALANTPRPDPNQLSLPNLDPPEGSSPPRH